MVFSVLNTFNSNISQKMFVKGSPIKVIGKKSPEKICRLKISWQNITGKENVTLKIRVTQFLFFKREKSKSKDFLNFRIIFNGMQSVITFRSF